MFEQLAVDATRRCARTVFVSEEPSPKQAAIQACVNRIVYAWYLVVSFFFGSVTRSVIWAAIDYIAWPLLIWPTLAYWTSRFRRCISSWIRAFSSPPIAVCTTVCAVQIWVYKRLRRLVSGRGSTSEEPGPELPEQSVAVSGRRAVCSTVRETRAERRSEQCQKAVEQIGSCSQDIPLRERFVRGEELVTWLSFARTVLQLCHIADRNFVLRPTKPNTKKPGLVVPRALSGSPKILIVLGIRFCQGRRFQCTRYQLVESCFSTLYYSLAIWSALYLSCVLEHRSRRELA